MFDFECCGDVGECSGVRVESHTALRDVVYDRGRVRSACRGGQGGDVCQIGNVFHTTHRVTLMEGSEEAKEMVENPLSSGRSKHIEGRWHFIPELAGKNLKSCMWHQSGSMLTTSGKRCMNTVQTAPQDIIKPACRGEGVYVWASGGRVELFV